MSEENKNENEEQDDFFGDDDDFGLPDLDFGELDEELEDAPLEEEVPSDLDSDDTPTEEPAPAEVEDSLDSIDMPDEGDEVGDIFGDSDEGIDVGEEGLDLGDDAIDISDEDLPDDFDDVLGDDAFADFEGSGDLDEEVPDSVFDSDILDDDEFKDFESDFGDTDQAFESSDNDTSTSVSSDAGSKGKFTRIVVLGTILFVVLGGGFWYLYTTLGGEEEEPVATTQKAPPKKTPPKQTTPAPKRTTTDAQASQQKATQPAATRPTTTSASTSRPTEKPATPVASSPGSVNRLGARTGNTFVIVGSFVDEDMANDFAKKLAAQGKSPSIIPPFGSRKYYYRVAVTSYPTIAAAQQNLESFRSEYGRDVWILKY